MHKNNKDTRIRDFVKKNKYRIRGGMRMGKCFTENIGFDILIIKTGINLYRTIPFFLCIMTLMMSVFGIVLDSKRIIEIHAYFFISLACLLLTIFMDKLVYVLKFPTNYLIVSKKEIVYKTRKKKFVYPTNTISYEFHSFFEDWTSLSVLKLISNDEVHYIEITQKQYKLMKQLLDGT